MSEFKDNEFDIVFSNSVIEHVGSFEDQLSMANELSRVGKKYFVQTPAFSFPIEPHYRALFFQINPNWLKTFRLRYFGVGRVKRCKTGIEAINEAKRIRLIKAREMTKLFPDAKIFKERFAGLTKSTVAYKGFN